MAALVLVIAPSKALFAPRLESGPVPEPDADIDWQQTGYRAIALSLAMQRCTSCRGSGLVGAKGPYWIRACDCVYRAIFRLAWSRRNRDIEKTASRPVCTLGTPRTSARRRSQAWGYKQLEYRADMDRTILETLSERDGEIFRLRFRACFEAAEIAAKSSMSPGDVRHAIYAIEKVLGEKFISMRPVPLYPIDEYFQGKMPVLYKPVFELRAA